MDNQLNADENEISLIDVFAVVWKFKWMIIRITAVAMIFIVGYSIVSKKLPPEKSFLPDVYTSSATMLIQEKDRGGNSVLSKLAGSGLGSLVGLTGLSSGDEAGYDQLALYLAESNSFLDAVINEFDLINRYKVKKFPKVTTRKMVKDKLKARVEDKSGLFFLSFKDIDPVFAQRVVVFAVDYYEKRFADMGLDKNKLEKENLEKSLQGTLDEVKRLEREASGLERRALQGGTVPSIALEAMRLKREIQVQEQLYGQLKGRYELLKIEMASEAPLFQVLDYPEVPEMKSEPSRGKLSIIVTFAAFFFSIFLAFLINAVNGIRQDPEAMAKLKGEQK